MLLSLSLLKFLPSFLRLPPCHLSEYSLSKLIVSYARLVFRLVNENSWKDTMSPSPTDELEWQGSGEVGMLQIRSLLALSWASFSP